jgi:predicted nuclease of predicted toxin-antitoxin system
LVFPRQSRRYTLRDNSLRRGNHYIILTHDLDFGAILAASRETSPSVVQIRGEDISPEASGKQTVAALRLLTSQVETGALVTIEADRTRVRLLPLNRTSAVA